jgi:hypothetical protein
MRAFGARRTCARGLRPFTATPLSVSFLSNSIRLRRGPHDSGMTGRFWPAVRTVQGASSRLPLSPARTYQEPPEGPRSFVQRGAPSWPVRRLRIALRMG